MDLIALLDGSSSVGEENFKKIKNFLLDVVDGLKMGLSDTRVGFIQYTSRYFIERETGINIYSDATSLSDNIQKIKYRGGTTYTGHAMNYTAKNGFITENVS